jgi:hypothetical protein
MKKTSIFDAFSNYRLGGEPIPEDVKILLEHAEALTERTSFELHWEKDWTPWTDTSYLSETELTDPDIIANIRATNEICDLISFVAADDQDTLIGYWRGSSMRAIAKSPLVTYDNEGQFDFCSGATLAEAILGIYGYGEEGENPEFLELRDWLKSIGITVQAKFADDLWHPYDWPDHPNKMRDELYERYKANPT